MTTFSFYPFYHYNNLVKLVRFRMCDWFKITQKVSTADRGFQLESLRSYSQHSNHYNMLALTGEMGPGNKDIFYTLEQYVFISVGIVQEKLLPDWVLRVCLFLSYWIPIAGANQISCLYAIFLNWLEMLTMFEKESFCEMNKMRTIEATLNFILNKSYFCAKQWYANSAHLNSELTQLMQAISPANLKIPHFI